MPESPEARIIETVRTKYIVFDEALNINSQKYEQNLPENCSESTEMAITVGLTQIFKNFPGGHVT